MTVDVSCRSLMLDVCRDDATSRLFCIREGLIGHLGDICQRQNFANNSNSTRPMCMLTINCSGRLKIVGRKSRGHTRQVYRCGTCKKERSLMTPTSVLMGHAPNPQQGSFFIMLDSLNRNQTKMPLHISLQILYYFAKDIPSHKIKELINDELGQKTYTTLTTWLSYIRECLGNALNTSGPMGGTGVTVQIDESFLRGRGKKNDVGDMLGGNKVASARQNYGQQVCHH